jgi:hypothetical protein
MHRYAIKRAIAVSMSQPKKKKKKLRALTVTPLLMLHNLYASQVSIIMVSHNTYHRLNLLSHFLVGLVRYPEGLAAL